MALETINAKIECKRPVAQSQVVIETRIPAPQNVTFKKLLSTGVDISLNAAEVFAGEARYGGKANFKCLLTDSEGKVVSLNSAAMFSDKIVSDNIMAAHKPRIYGKVVDTDVVALNESELKIAAVVDVVMFSIESNDLNMLAGDDEDILTHQNKIEFNSLQNELNESLFLTDSLDDIKGTQLLFVHSKAILRERKAGIDFIGLSGEVISEVYVLTDDGIVVNYKKNTSFNKEIAVFDIPNDCIISADAVLNSFTSEFITEGDSARVEFEFSIDLNAAVFYSNFTEVVTDAFCVEYELVAKTEQVSILKNKLNLTVTETIDGSITLGNDMPAADTVLGFSSAKVLDTNSYTADGKVTIEGIVSGDVIYYNAEHSAVNSVSAELPFSLTTNLNVEQGDIISVRGSVFDASLKIRRESIFDIKTDICFEINVLTKEQHKIITEIKKGEKRPEPEGTIAIYIAKEGEDLWDTAKVLQIPPEKILKQNPSLALPFKGGERVIAYRHLKN